MEAIEIGNNVASVRGIDVYRVEKRTAWVTRKPDRFAWLAARVTDWLIRIGALRTEVFTERVYASTNYTEQHAKKITEAAEKALSAAHNYYDDLALNDFVLVMGAKEFDQMAREPFGMMREIRVWMKKIRFGRGYGCEAPLYEVYGNPMIVLPHISGVVAIPRFHIEDKKPSAPPTKQRFG